MGNREGSGDKSAASQLQILPAAASVKLGDQIAITLQAQNVSPMEKTSLTLNYNPSVVTFKQAGEGSLWTSNKIDSNLTVTAVPHLGRLVIQMGQQGKPIEGNGSLATVVFEAAGQGTSNIQIQDSAVLGHNAQSMPVMVQHGRIWVE